MILMMHGNQIGLNSNELLDRVAGIRKSVVCNNSVVTAHSPKMTSRLKHRLELENVNLKSSYLNESFVQVGGIAVALAHRRLERPSQL